MPYSACRLRVSEASWQGSDMGYAGALFSVEQMLIRGVTPWYRLNRSLNHLLGIKMVCPSRHGSVGRRSVFFPRAVARGSSPVIFRSRSSWSLPDSHSAFGLGAARGTSTIHSSCIFSARLQTRMHRKADPRTEKLYRNRFFNPSGGYPSNSSKAPFSACSSK